MSGDDRRSGSERRSTNRFPVEAPIEWDAGGEQKEGTMSDVSYDGCFVMTGGDVANGTTVRIFLALEDGVKVQYAGKVANSVAEIGFGVRFDQLTAAQREVLVRHVKSSREN